MSVIKRSRSSSSKDLQSALEEFIVLLRGQDEEEAVADLSTAMKSLGGDPAADGHKSAISMVVDAFEGDHELSAYILDKPDPDEWTDAEQLSQAATRVLNLARRLR